MRWGLRRLILGDRRHADRVLEEATSALRRLDRALWSVEMATNCESDQRDRDDR